MEVWRPQLQNYYSAKVYCCDFHVKAMNKYESQGFGNEELGDCEQRKGLVKRVVALCPAELPRFALIEVPFSPGTAGEETPQDEKSGHGSLKPTVALERPAANC